MKKYIFVDTITKEKFEATCYPFEVQNLHLYNSEFAKWVTGRIIKYSGE